jgi:inorganic pyrophosphatase
MADDKGQDDKIIAVHVDDPQYADYRDIREVPQHILAELQRFFLDYKVLERKQVAIEALQGHAEAETVILAAIDLYASRAESLRRAMTHRPPVVPAGRCC